MIDISLMLLIPTIEGIFLHLKREAFKEHAYFEFKALSQIILQTFFALILAISAIYIAHYLTKTVGRK